MNNNAFSVMIKLFAVFTLHFIQISTEFGKQNEQLISSNINKALCCFPFTAHPEGYQYCFQYNTCSGVKMAGFEGVPTDQATCCNGGGGSWGRTGQSCTKCDTSDGM